MMKPLLDHKQQSAVLPISKVFLQSWKLISGIKFPVMLIYLSTFLPIIAGAIFAFFILLPLLYLIPALFFLMIVGVFVTLFFLILSLSVWYAITVLSIIGIRQSLGLPVKLSTIFSQCMNVKLKLLGPFFIWLTACVIFAVLKKFFFTDGALGIILHFLCYLVFIYIVVPLHIFACPLIVIKQSSISSAISSAYHKMSLYYLEILFLYLVQSAIIFVSIIPLGIGLIWTIPMYYAMTGIIFSRVYHLKNKNTTSRF